MKFLRTLLLLAGLITVRAEAADPLAGFFARLKAGEKQTVVAFGTSLTAYGAWVPQMQQWFEEKFPGQVHVINSGGPGQHSDWGAAQVSSRVLAHSPNLVFVEFSYNDAHTRFKLTPEHCRKNLESIIEAITSADPSTAIVLQTMNAPWDPPEGRGMTDSATNRPEPDVFNDNYRAVARERGLPLVDNYPDWLKIKETNMPRRIRIFGDPHRDAGVPADEVLPGIEESEKTATLKVSMRLARQA